MIYGKEKIFFDIAHMHPVCPLSLSHARIFVLADVWARWKRKQGFSV
jgi:methionyl-tRNA synthetase